MAAKGSLSLSYNPAYNFLKLEKKKKLQETFKKYKKFSEL